MMIKNDGYTLVELLAIVAILGIISVISAPSIIKMVDNNKKDKMLQDAVTLVSRTKNKVAVDREFRNDENQEDKTYLMRDLVKSDEMTNDPDGGTYDRNSSFVRYYKLTGRYCVYLVGSKKMVASHVGASISCAFEDYLYSRESVIDKT